MSDREKLKVSAEKIKELASLGKRKEAIEEAHKAFKLVGIMLQNLNSSLSINLDNYGWKTVKTLPQSIDLSSRFIDPGSKYKH